MGLVVGLGILACLFAFAFVVVLVIGVERRKLAQKELQTQSARYEQMLAEKDRLIAAREQDYKERILEREREMTRRLAEKDDAYNRILGESIKALQDRFSSLAEKRLAASAESLSELNRKNLETVFNPFKEELLRLRDDFTENRKEQAVNRITFDRAIKDLGERTKQIGAEAENLARALKHESKTQGNWGEMILENILDAAGFKNGVDFETQAQEDGPHGERLIPDVEIRLPDSGKLIIDSKTSITAYLDYVGAEDDAAREAAAKAHVASVRKHMMELADKAYMKKVAGSQDYLLMFIPNEGSYILAMDRDRKLATDAFNRHIIIVNPTTLLLCLQIVALLRAREAQNENAEKIASAAGRMYDKFSLFVDIFEKVGDNLNTAQANYKIAFNRLCEGPANVVKQMESLKNMGVVATKVVSEKIRNAAKCNEA